MTRYTFGIFILRLVVPCLMAFSTAIRPSVMSMIYLAMLCYLPFVNLIELQNIDAGTFKYIMIFLPYQMIVTQFGFYLYTITTDELNLPEFSSLKRTLKNIGLSALDQPEVMEVLCWYGPEAIMFVVSGLYTWAVRMMANTVRAEEQMTDEDELEALTEEKIQYLRFSVSAGKFVMICLLFAAAMWRLSVFGILYFALFLFLTTYWALYKNVVRLLAIVIFTCLPFALLHIAFQYAYQIEMVQTAIAPDNVVLRYLGIDLIVEVGPEHGSNFTHYVYHTDDILNLTYPIVTYALYYFMVVVGMMLYSLETYLQIERRKQARARWKRLSRKIQKLVRGEKTQTRPNVFLFSLPDRRRNEKYDKFMNVVDSIVSLIVEYSYVGSIVIIMIWSVTFINVASLVMLVWGILLWLLPKRRIVTQYSVMVITCLVYINLIYTYVSGILNFEQQTFTGRTINILMFLVWHRKKSLELCIKVLYTVMFWVTIRQYMQSRKFEEGFILATTKSEFDTHQKKTIASRVIEKLLRNVLVKYWLVLIGISMYIDGITGREMNIFRITTMFKYLVFMLLLQISFTLWRRLLYAFMLLLILMGLFTMVLAYSYEFRYLDKYFYEPFGITREMHQYLGLSFIDTKREYLNRIIMPTLHIVMCLIQITFFHKPFMAVTDPNNTDVVKDEEEDEGLFGETWQTLKNGFITLALVMEQHLLKLVILSLFLMCIYDACALYLLILGPLCFSLMFGRYCQLAVIYFAAVLVSAHCMLRMVYALKFFNEDVWSVTCNVTKHPEIKQNTRNLALWVGFWKWEYDQMSLNMYLLWPSWFVFFSTIYTTTRAKLYIYRKQRGLPVTPPKVIFPDVTHKTAELSLVNYIKYMMNYGFYRLGYEITLIMVTVVIAFRQDGYSIVYSGWLCVLLITPRFILRYIWWIFVLFLCLVITCQYVMAIGLPPHWCMEFEWERQGYFWSAMQDFWFLMDNYRPPPINKLVPEILLLMFASHQMFNFYIELKYRKSREYDGGSNHSAIGDFEKPGFENPLEDFTTYTRSYLDIFKRFFFNFSYWGSIWIVFLGSVNRANIFSIVYLLFVFTYIWFGINLYYQPLRAINRNWNHLIAQNVFILVAKSCLQIVGCFYMHLIPNSYCHLVKLLAIGCVRRFRDKAYFKEMDEKRGVCKSTDDELFGISWDAAIFAFLIIQKRVFASYNFFHIIDDAKASHVLSRRGGEILEEIRQNEINAIRDEQKKIAERIALKHQRVEATEKRIDAIRAGDYTIFDDHENEVEIDILPRKETDQKKARKRNILSLLTDTFGYDLRFAVESYWDKSDQPAARRRDLLMEKPYTWTTKIVYFFRLLIAIFNVLVVSLTEYLDTYTERYVTVIEKLQKEKRELKEKTDYNVGVRVEGWWLPRASYENLLKNSTLQKPKKPPKEMSTPDTSDILNLFNTIKTIAVAKSDQLSYLCVILNQIILCELIILPQSMMVWFWGSLSNPRPSKTFWIIMIGYVELTILLKCIFQFEMMPGNTMRKILYFQTKMAITNPFYPPTFFGLYKTDLYYLYEMFTLIAVIIQRNYLKRLGLWQTLKSASVKLDGDYAIDNSALVPVERGKTPAERTLNVTSTKASPVDNILLSLSSIFIKYAEGVRDFYQRLLLHVSQLGTDLYTVMFWCDFISFLIVIIGYGQFFEEEAEDSVASFFVTSTIPVMFVMICFAHCMATLIDRCIYLKKNVLAKLIFQMIQVLWLHFFIFILFPMMRQGSQANGYPAPMLYYVMRCFYFLISAYQIRCGYQSRIWDFFCCVKYTLVSFCAHKAYMLIPFLFEVRATIDFILFETSLNIFDFWKMHDIYVNVYSVKCQRALEEDYPSPAGKKKKEIFKCLWGLSFFIFIVGILWIPVMLYSFGREAGVSNIPSSARLTVSVGPDILYNNEATIYTIYNQDLDNMKTIYKAYGVSQDFFYSYDYTDVAVLAFDTGGQIWLIPEQNKELMEAQLKGAHPTYLVAKTTVTLISPEGETKEMEHVYRSALYPNSKARFDLIKMINGDVDQTPIHLKYVVPKFLKVKQSGKSSPVDILMRAIPDRRASFLRNLTINIQKWTGGIGIWWEVKEQVGDHNYEHILDKLAYGVETGTIIMYTFGDKLAIASTITFFGGGVLGLYSLYLLFFQGHLRHLLLNYVDKLYLTEAANVDRLHRIVAETFTFREYNDVLLEGYQYRQLVWILSSKETILKMARYKPNPYDVHFIVPPSKK